ncbi:MAG: hypothetical protein ABIA76_00500 [Candidatus Diapherotrites archaeon]
MIKLFSKMKNKFIKMKTDHQITFALMVGVALICFWRGAWMMTDLIFDKILFPDSELLSALTAMGVGAIILMLSGMLVRELT